MVPWSDAAANSLVNEKVAAAMAAPVEVSEYWSVSRRFLLDSGLGFPSPSERPPSRDWLCRSLRLDTLGAEPFPEPFVSLVGSVAREPAGQGEPVRLYAYNIMRIHFHLALFVFVTANTQDDEQDPLISAIYTAHVADDLYGILGIRPRSKQSQLKEAYRKRARLVSAEKRAASTHAFFSTQVHPDKNRDVRPRANGPQSSACMH